MLLTTGILALSRKISDKRAKEKQAKEQLLRHENGNHERRHISPLVYSDHAFQSSFMSSVPQNGPGTGRYVNAAEGQFRQPSDIPIMPQTEQAPRLSNDSAATSSLSPRGDPPPYSPTGRSSSITTSIANTSTLEVPNSAVTRDLISDTSTLASVSSSGDDHCLRIRTKGTDLKSGFPYHPDLFELRVRPELWERFTAQVVEATRFSKGDYAQMVGAATATALTGALLTSVYVGRSMNHSLQEKKVKAGLTNMDDGGLGDLLKQWNENEFKKLGIFVHMELSASAMKRLNHRSPTLSKHPLMYSRREDRDRKTEERKFCLVVSHLDDEGVPADAIQEIVHEAADESTKVVEAPNPENVIFEVPELPGDEGRYPIELPAGVSLGYGTDKFAPNCAELDSTPVSSEKWDPDSKTKELEGDDVIKLMHEPLMITAETHAALSKEIT